MALDAALTLLCKRREDSFLLIDNEGSPTSERPMFDESHEVDNLGPISPRQLGEAGSSSSGSGHGADENQPRHANMDRVDAMKIAAQQALLQAAIREQVANEMESACKSMSLHRNPSMNVAMGCSPSGAQGRATSPFGGPRVPLVQQQPLPFSRVSSMASTSSFATQDRHLVRASSSDSFRSTSSFHSASALRSGVLSPRPARPASGGSTSVPSPAQRQSRRPHESPQWSPGSAGPGRSMPDSFRFAEADSFRASTPTRQGAPLRRSPGAAFQRPHPAAASNRSTTPTSQRPISVNDVLRHSGPRLGTPQCSGGRVYKYSAHADGGRTSRAAASSGSAVATNLQEQDDRVMSNRLNAASDLIDGLRIDSSMLEEARRTSELGREADAISARKSPEKTQRRSRSCNVFWRPPPEAARVCESARSSYLSRQESADGYGGSAAFRTASENSRPLAQVLGMGCSALVPEDGWGPPPAVLSFGAVQSSCGARCAQAEALQAHTAPGIAARPNQSRHNRSIMLSPRGTAI